MTTSARRTVDLDGNLLTIVDDDPAPPELLWWTVLRTRVIDEITEAPPRAPARFSNLAPARCVPRIGRDGLCGLLARPLDIATALVTPGALQATLAVDGYLPQVLDAAIDAARRTLPAGALAGTTQLTFTPPEDPARLQFRAGRGVMIERPAPPAPEQYALDADPPAPPAVNQLTLDTAVSTPRAAGARIAGVPLCLPDQRLHRAGTTRLRGRVLRQAVAGGTPIPAPAAQLGLAGTWWTNAEIASLPAPPHAPRIVAFESELMRPHAQGTLVSRIATTPDGLPRRLATRAYAGDPLIQLRTWSGLASTGGDVLQIEADGVAEMELVVTDAVVIRGDPAQPTQVSLRVPLARPHAANCTVTRVTVVATPIGNLEREAVPGDQVLYASALTGLAATDLLSLGDTAPDAELRVVQCLPTFAGGSYAYPVAIAADGSFELPPIARAAQLLLQVAHAGHPVQPPILCVPEPGSDLPLSILITP